MRGAACLSVGDIEANWERLISKFTDPSEQGIVRTSFAEFGAKVGLPETVRNSLHDWAVVPGNIATLRSIEAFSRTFLEALEAMDDLTEATSNKLYTSIGIVDSNLATLEGLDVLGLVSLMEVTRQVVDKTIQAFSIECLEYVLALCVVEPGNPMSWHERLILLLKARGKFGDTLESAKMIKISESENIAPFWLKFWTSLKEKSDFRAFRWRPAAPRLSRSFDAYLDSHDRDTNADPALDSDELVRFSAARSPRASIGQLRLLATDQSLSVRTEVARNRSCPSEVLDGLLRDDNGQIRMWAVYNRSAKRESLEALKSDPEERVRNAVAKRLSERP